MTQGNGHGGNGAAHARPGLSFPCRYDIKAIGRESARFDALVQAIVERHVGPTDLLAVNRRLSAERRYLAVTFVITARSYAQLDALYCALGACDDVLFCI
jgi:putative lipoic acid-binding regulatory protein